MALRPDAPLWGLIQMSNYWPRGTPKSLSHIKWVNTRVIEPKYNTHRKAETRKKLMDIEKQKQRRKTVNIAKQKQGKKENIKKHKQGKTFNIE